ncbi:hypothetical protein ES703_124265 [subsurface metagenome]
MEGKVQAAQDLILNLVRATENVGVVLGETSYPQQAVHDARTFVTVDRAHFGPAEGQFAVASGLAAVYHDMERAVHRLDEKLVAVDVHG